MDILRIADAIAALVEPDPTLRDDTREHPSTYDVDVLYLWPVSEGFTPVDTGQTDEESFRLALAWCVSKRVDAEGRRDVSDLIVEHRENLGAVVKANRAYPDLYEWLQIDGVDYEGLLGLDMRGYVATLSGYRYRGG